MNVGPAEEEGEAGAEAAPDDGAIAASSPPPPPPLPRAVVTHVLVGLCVVASGLSFLTDANLFAPTTEHLVAWGANFGLLTVGRGQWWRLVTCAFLHGGWLHLAVNMWVLRSLGPPCERAFGRVAYVILYVVAALGASLASLAWRPLGVSVGASGAIFGLAGAYLAFLHGLRDRVGREVLGRLRQSLLSFVVINLFIGATLPFVDNAAHLGGLVAGALASFLLGARPFRESRGPWLRLLAPAGLALAVLAGLGVAVRHRVLARPEVGASLATERGEAARAQGRYDEALAEYDRAVSLAPGNPAILMDRAILHTRRDEPEAAARDAGAVIAQKDGALPRVVRAWAFVNLRQLDAAAADFERALKLDPRAPGAAAGLARVRALQGRISEAWPLYAQALADSPDDLSLLMGRAAALQDAGRFTEALADLDRALRVAPKSATVHNNRAWLLRLLGRLDDSLRAADMAVALDPKSAPALGTRGWTRFALGDRRGALADCREAVRLRPGTLVDVGLIAFIEGDRLAALDAWQKAIESGEASAADLGPWLEQVQRPEAPAPGS